MENCVICGHKQKLLFHYLKYRYYRCSYCMLVSTYPIPSAKTILNHYKTGFKKGNYKFLRKYSQSYKSVYRQFVKIIKLRLSERNDTLLDKKILDIGCFTGDFLELVKAEGANVYGLELQKEAVAIANKKLPGRVLLADVMTHKFPQKNYDIITLQGLLEHVPDPLTLLNRCSKLLKQGGIIMIQTPNSSSHLAHILGKYWPPYTPIEHMHLFGRKSMGIALKKSGFNKITYKVHWKILPINYVYNMFNTFGPEFKLFLAPFDKLLKKMSLPFPFYIGEFIVLAQKK